MAAPATPVSNSQRSPVNRPSGTSATSLIFNRSRNPSGESGVGGGNSGGWVFDGTQTQLNGDGPKWVTNGRRSKTQQAPGKTINVEVKNRIFIGGLQSNMNEDDLRTLFGQYGEITEVLIKERGTQERRGFGFVTYGNKPGRSGEEAATLARKEGADERLEIRGVKINVQRATRIVHTSEDQRQSGVNATQQSQIPVMPFMPQMQMPFMPMMSPAFYPPQYYPYNMYDMNRGLPSSQPGWPAGMPTNQMWPMNQGYSNAAVMPPIQSYTPAMHTPPPDAEPAYNLRTPINSANRGSRDLERSSAGRSVGSSDSRRADGRVPGIRISDFDDDSEDLTVRLSQSMNLDANYDGVQFYPMHTRNSRMV